MTEPDISLTQPISGTSILEGMTKAIQSIPKDQRQDLSFSFYVVQHTTDKTIKAQLHYAYTPNLSIRGYVQKVLEGDLEAGVVVNWRMK